MGPEQFEISNVSSALVNPAEFIRVLILITQKPLILPDLPVIHKVSLDMTVVH